MSAPGGVWLGVGWFRGASSGVSAPGVSALGRGVSAPRGVSALGRGVSALGRGVSAPGGCLLWGGGVVSQHALRQTPPLWTKSQMPVKTLPWPNFIAAGNDRPDDYDTVIGS